MARVLVVDDENLMRTMVEVACRRLGHEALCAATLAEGRRLAAAGVDVILLDMLLPDGNGLDAQQELAALPDAPDIVVITGHGDGDAAEKALRGGVWDFLMKPVRVRDVEETLSHVLEARDRRRSRRGLELEPGQVAGSGPAMQAALAQLEQAAHSDVNVLLLGETGVGKELFARTLYRNSHRASRPFVAVDCASLPETLVESHLFGHARGAFTGAERASEGLLRAAHQGTLFLDEVGDLPQGIQGAFLRALELRRFRPVGEVREVESDFRLVAATNQDLEAMSEDGRFRKDLLYRLQGMTIVIPPLRRRRDEIPLLARQAVIRCCRRNGMEEKELSPLLLEMLAEYDWPGNVRELFHALERACLAAEHASLLLPAHLATGLRVAVARSRAGQGRVAGHVPGGREVCPPLAEAGACSVPDLPPMPETGRAFPSLRSWRHEAERHYVARVRALCGDDARAAARMAGVSRGHWYELLKNTVSRPAGCCLKSAQRLAAGRESGYKGRRDISQLCEKGLPRHEQSHYRERLCLFCAPCRRCAAGQCGCGAGRCGISHHPSWRRCRSGRRGERPGGSDRPAGAGGRGQLHPGPRLYAGGRYFFLGRRIALSRNARRTGTDAGGGRCRAVSRLPQDGMAVMSAARQACRSGRASAGTSFGT